MAGRLDTRLIDREVRSLLAAARWSAADLEQVLATVARIDPADADSWLREWTATGGEAWAAGQRERAPGQFLCAASYYGTALALIAESDGFVDETALWLRQRECWDRAVLEMGGAAVTVPYEMGRLPGYLFSGGRVRRPVVVVDPGGRMPTSQAWAQVAAAAHRRGAHVLIFDGPGRQAALRLGGLVARPDWEAVITPVVELLLAREDVDGARMAVVGMEFGALGVARALTAEHRFAAAALLPGVLDGARPWMAQMPDAVHAALVDAERDVFERELHLASLFDPEINDRLRRAASWFDPGGLDLYELYRRIRTFRFEPAGTGQVLTPTMVVCDPLDDGPWSGQSSELAAALGPAATLVHGRRPEDALADWLDDVFSRATDVPVAVSTR